MSSFDFGYVLDHTAQIRTIVRIRVFACIGSVIILVKLTCYERSFVIC